MIRNAHRYPLKWGGGGGSRSYVGHLMSDFHELRSLWNIPGSHQLSYDNFKPPNSDTSTITYPAGSIKEPSGILKPICIKSKSKHLCNAMQRIGRSPRREIAFRAIQAPIHDAFTPTRSPSKLGWSMAKSIWCPEEHRIKGEKFKQWDTRCSVCRAWICGAEANCPVYPVACIISHYWSEEFDYNRVESSSWT